MRTITLSIFACILVWGFLGCSKTEEADPFSFYKKQWDQADIPAPRDVPDDSLNILIWRDYFPEDLFLAFEEIYGVAINVTYFNSNEDLRQTYQEDPSRWDLLMPSDYMASYLIRNEQLQFLQKASLTNMRNLIPHLFSLDFDPGLQYFVPYFYSSLGISFNVSYVGGFPRGWDFVEEQKNNRFSMGRVAIPNQVRVAFAHALLYLGEDPNTTDPEIIGRAKDHLIELIEEMGAHIVGDEIIVDQNWQNYVMIFQWSGTGAYLLSEDLDYRFLIPEGPAVVAVDGFVIPHQTEKIDTINLFLEFLMTPEIAALSSDFSFYAPVNYVAERRISNFTMHGPSLLLPSSKDWTTLEDIGDAEAYYLEAWFEVLEAKPNRDINVIPLPTN